MVKKNLESHFTATGFVLNPVKNKILFIFHKKLQIWLPPGGHIDAGELPHDAVVREVFEETGIESVIQAPVYDLDLIGYQEEAQIPAPLYVLHEHIPAWGNKPEHMHYDFIYVLDAKNTTVNPALEEVDHVHWFTLSEILECQTTKGTKNICKKLLSLNV
jgi:ADP-ribose pyrophosphatase YjhB (NUDIX family)